MEVLGWRSGFDEKALVDGSGCIFGARSGWLSPSVITNEGCEGSRALPFSSQAALATPPSRPVRGRPLFLAMAPTY